MFFEPNRVVLDPSTCFFDARIVLLEPSKVAVYSMLSMSVQREIRVETFLRPLVAHPLLALSQAANAETFDTPIDGPISSSSIITIIHHPSSIIRRPSPVIRHPPSVIRHPLSLHHLPTCPLPNVPCALPHPIHRTPSPSKNIGHRFGRSGSGNGLFWNCSSGAIQPKCISAETHFGNALLHSCESAFPSVLTMLFVPTRHTFRLEPKVNQK